MQGRSAISVSVRLYDNLHILIERHEKAQKSLNRKLPPQDWQSHYGHLPLLLETLVDAAIGYRGNP